MNPLRSDGRSPVDAALLGEIRDYWNTHIHDLQIATQPMGTVEFFAELAEYRFDKLGYLQEIVDSSVYAGKRVLEVGCGAGIDLIRFARAGAIVTGVDLAETSIDLARESFAQQGLTADLEVMNGEDLAFEDGTFDVAYGHGVLQYTANDERMVSELHRVLRPGGEAVLVVYNTYSWLNLLSKLTRVELEHEDAPVMRTYSTRRFRGLLSAFPEVRIVCQRFPVKTRLHRGLMAILYNELFVTGFNALPRVVTRSSGWHLVAFARRGSIS